MADILGIVCVLVRGSEREPVKIHFCKTPCMLCSDRLDLRVYLGYELCPSVVTHVVEQVKLLEGPAAEQDLGESVACIDAAANILNSEGLKRSLRVGWGIRIAVSSLALFADPSDSSSWHVWL